MSWRSVLWTAAVLLSSVSSPLRGEELALDRLEHFNTRHGLSQNWVLTLAQDPLGFLWVGTDDGLNRYDGHRFKVYRHAVDDPTSLSDNFIISVAADHTGALWVGTPNGLNRLDRRTGRFTRFFHDPADPDSLAHNFVTAVREDRQGTVWVGTMQGLHRFDRETQRFFDIQPTDDQPDLPGAPGLVRLHVSNAGTLWAGGAAESLYRYHSDDDRFERFDLGADDPTAALWTLGEDTAGRLWMGTTEGVLLCFDPDTGTTRRFSLPGVKSINSVAPQTDGSVWVGTEEAGLLVFSPETGVQSRFGHQPDNPGSLPDDRVMTLLTDRTGVRWIGTEAGLAKLDPSRSRFSHLRHRPADPNSLSADWISLVVEDRQGNLWVGNSGEGLNRLDASGVNTRFRNDPNDPHSLWDDAVMALREGADGRFWIATHSGIGSFDPHRGRFARLGSEVSGAVPEDWIYDLFESDQGVLWIAGQGGVYRLDPRRGVGQRLGDHPKDASALNLDMVYDLELDRAGDLWLAAPDTGLLRIPREQVRDRVGSPVTKVQHFFHQDDDPQSLGNDRVAAVKEDSRGILWLATFGGGLGRAERTPRDGGGLDLTFRHYGQPDGLPSDVVVSIVEDDQGFLWLGTHQGLVRFDPVGEHFKVYGVEDGLQGTAFLLGAVGRRANGELFFGGTAGLNGFFPQDLVDDPVPPEVAITDFRLFNRSQPLTARAETRADGELELVLSHRDSVVAFEFAALHFAKPGKNHYAYRLEGFNDAWIETDARDRLAQYTNLDPGSYVFRVKASNPDGLWNETGAQVRLRITPPPWRTGWAYGLYLLTLLAAVTTYLRWQRAKVERERAIAERERAANQRLRQADRLKDEFLANTSHELRTPLYGITGLAESLLDGAVGEMSREARENLALIVSSGRRLGHLVNDILDFSKLRHESLELDRRPLDLRALAEVVLALSRPLIGARDLELVRSMPDDLPPVDADENRLQQILHNLVGNAIKFTDSGSVEILAEVVYGRVQVRVRDTGIGIPADQQARIFDAFTQTDGTTERRFGGTGLGLAVTRHLVELHGGSLGVESRPGEGATFHFDLAIASAPAVAQAEATGEPGTDALAPEAVVLARQGAAGGPALAGASDGEPSDAEPLARLLVVDDEPVNRRILTNQLGTAGYAVEAVANGPAALDRIGEESFDLILLDVMMPRLSGYEVCRTLRQQFSIDELPVLFLTAKSQPSDLVVGLAAGANDYLPKPISKTELLARVKTHLDLRTVNRQLAELVVERTTQVSEREQLLEEREQLIHQLESKNAELARFNYTVAHDLKNPLTTIMNFLGLARRDAAEGEVHRLEHDFDRLQQAADTLRQVLDELFEYSRVGMKTNPAEPVALGEMVDKALITLADLITERRAQVTVVSELSTVQGDRPRIEELVLHLVRNALIHVAESTAPRVEIGERDDDGQQVFYVRDNGLGVAPSYHERIFDLFERLDPARNDGSGIGLALARRIAEAQGGRLWIESEGEGHGSIFCWALP